MPQVGKKHFAYNSAGTQAVWRVLCEEHHTVRHRNGPNKECRTHLNDQYGVWTI